MRHKYSHFHYTAEHQEQDQIALKEKNSREERPCVCSHMLKIFTEASKFHLGHASSFADSHGNGTSGFNRDVTILEEKRKMFILERGSQFLQKYKRMNSLVMEYCCDGLSIHLLFASKEVFSKLSPPVSSFL